MSVKEAEFESPHEILDLDPEILKKAKEGSSFAQLDIGKAYYSTSNLDNNCKISFHWLMLSAGQGNMEAQFRLGDMFAIGQGIGKNEYTSYEWYLKSAIKGYPKALTRLHNLYHTEKSMYCRGQRDSKEAEWTTADFKKENNIRELYEYRVQQMESKLTKIREYFTTLLSICREIVDDDEQDDKQDAYLKLGFLYQHGYGIRKIKTRAIEFYTLAAEKGNVDAAYNLGYIYHYSPKIKWNYNESFKWYTKATENGQIYAYNGLAFLYLKGLGTDNDYPKAIDLYTKAAENRNIGAMISLAKIFRQGKIVKRDYGKSAEWYKKATIEGSTVAQNSLELLYVNKHVPLDETDRYPEKVSSRVYSKKGLISRLRSDISRLGEAADLEKLKKLAMNAMKGDGYAMLDIGMKYYNGDYFFQDKNVAFTWIRNAAKTGITTIQCIFAKMYKDGDCVEQDYHKASIWYEKAAKKRDIQARYNFGLMCYHGLGVRKDPLEASRWYTFAADKNNSDAQCQLGILRKNGEGLRQDSADALSWFNISARQNNPRALYQLARMYENGTVEKSNFNLALMLYKKAAQLGSLNAQLKLADMYNTKETQHCNEKKAFKYYEMAANQGSPEAKYKLAIMYLDGRGVIEGSIKAYHLFKESSELGYDKSTNIFNTPIDYSKTDDIDYRRVEDMFLLVCRHEIDSLEYNLGYHYSNNLAFLHDGQPYPKWLADLFKEMWFERAAEKGVPEAYYKLALICEEEEDLSKAVKCYEISYKLGNVDAGYKLACAYLYGDGISQNLQKAFILFNETSDKGHKEAFKTLNFLKDNDRSERNKAIKKMLQKSAESGNIISQYKLGVFEIESKVSDYRIQEGIKWLYMASKGGFIEASYRLALLFENNADTEKNYREIVRLYQVAAEKGHEKALFRLARLYHFGDNVEENYVKAYEFYTSAAQQGYPPAQLAVNITTESNWKDKINQLDDNLEKQCFDYVSYFYMWEYIAEKGNVDLQYKLGVIYQKNGGDDNMVQAAKWYSKAAHGSHDNALYNLGRLYETGQGVTQDYTKAIELYKRAGDINNNQALYQLGVIYQNGKGVNFDSERAHGYYIRAAKKGNSAAQFALGRLYEEGDYLPQNKLEAFKRYSISASQGNKDAENWLKTHYDIEDTTFYRRKINLLCRINRHYYHTNVQNTFFLGAANYELGQMYHYGNGTPVNYKIAWEYYWISLNLYGDIRAKELLTIKYENIDISIKDSYLKKLEMHEALVEQLSIEDIYELGSIYYHGVYPYSNDLRAYETQVIVRSDHHKSSKYFRMIIERNLPHASEYYMNCSYYLGMIYFVDTKHTNDSSQAKYYLVNALNSGSFDAQLFLDYIENRNAGKMNEALLFKKAFECHRENLNTTHNKLLYNLGWMHEEGLGTQIDHKKAVEYYNNIISKNFNVLYLGLGHAYFNDSELEKENTVYVEWYTKTVEQSRKIVNYRLGNIYFYGKGLKTNYMLAFQHYMRAADQEFSHAQAQIGLLYAYGYGVEQNHTKAIEWCTKAVNQNSVIAYHNLGAIYFYGLGTEINYSLAFQYYKAAADQGNSNAQNTLGVMYANGDGIEQNYITAIEWYTKAANKNHTFANYNLGLIYYEGHGGEKNNSLAFQYYKTAADRGNSNAQSTLGIMYANGDGIEQNYITAIEWYTKAANQNDVIANYNLGVIYYDGQGVEKDYKLAFQYCKAAADQEHCNSQILLGIMYSQGLGIEANYGMAVSLFTRASSEDSAMARLGEMYHSINNEFQNFSKAFECYSIVDKDDSKISCALRGIGLLYEHGDCVQKNYKMALDYYKQSAERENKGAYYNLAILYYYGKGVKKNYGIALKWFYRVIEENPEKENIYVFVQVKNNSESDLLAEKQREYSMVSESIIYGEAHYYLGHMYKQGQGTDINHEIALNHFNTARLHNIERAQEHTS